MDAGTIGRDTLRKRDDLERRTRPDRLDGTVTAPGRERTRVAPGGPTFVLAHIRFGSSSFLSPEELQALAAPYLGRPITLADIQALVDAVNGLYTQRGHVAASAILPPQSVRNGELRIDLLEGRLGNMKVEGADTSLGAIRRRIGMEPGSVVDVPRLSRAVSLFNRTSETQLRTILQPGTQFGLTDVVISATQPPQDRLQVVGDNLGTSTVGSLEGSALYQHYGMLGLDDSLKVYATRSRGNSGQNLSYTLGVNDEGGRVGLSFGRTSIHLIDKDLRDLDVSGGLLTGAVNAAQPIYDSANWLVLLNAAAEYSASKTKQGSTVIADNGTSKGTVGVTLRYYGDNVTISMAPTLSRAITSLAVTERKLDNDLLGGSASAVLKLPGAYYAQALGSWQISAKRLLPGSQSFQIGGPTTVRGYPSSGVAGSSGYYANFELHRSMDGIVPGWDLFAFIDHGTVYSTFPKQTILTSAGIGTSVTVHERVTGELTVAFPLTSVVTRQPDCQIYGRVIVRVF